MNEFPPQNAVIPQETLVQHEASLQAEYADLRDMYRALKAGTADRDALIGLGNDLEAAAVREPDENGELQVVGFRGPVMRDKEGVVLLDENDRPLYTKAKIPKTITNAVFEAAKAAREDADPSAWSKAAKVDEISELSFSQAKALVKSLNQGASLEKAYDVASEAPKETPTAEAKIDSSKKEAEQPEENDAKTEVRDSPVDEVLKQLKSPDSSAKLAEAVANLDDKQLESVVKRLSSDLSESLGVISSESIAQLNPLVIAKGLDEYISKHTLPGADSSVKNLHLAAVRSFLSNVAESAPDVLQAIVIGSESSLVREYRNDEVQHTAIETRREVVAPQAGDVAVRGQLQKGQGRFHPEDYDLAA